MNDEIPGWAIDLIRQIERLNEKLPNHVEWVQRNLLDHEKRIRQLEKKLWLAAGAAAMVGGFGSQLVSAFAR